MDTYLLKLTIEKYESVNLMIEEYEFDKKNGEKFTPVKTSIYEGLIKSKKKLRAQIKRLAKTL